MHLRFMQLIIMNKVIPTESPTSFFSIIITTFDDGTSNRKKYFLIFEKIFSNQNNCSKIKIAKMKKMHICFYALFQISSVQSESPTEPVTEPVTGLPDPVIVTENTNDCTKDLWGYCVCDNDEYRKGF